MKAEIFNNSVVNAESLLLLDSVNINAAIHCTAGLELLHNDPLFNCLQNRRHQAHEGWKRVPKTLTPEG